MRHPPCTSSENGVRDSHSAMKPRAARMRGCGGGVTGFQAGQAPGDELRIRELGLWQDLLRREIRDRRPLPKHDRPLRRGARCPWPAIDDCGGRCGAGRTRPGAIEPLYRKTIPIVSRKGRSRIMEIKYNYFDHYGEHIFLLKRHSIYGPGLAMVGHFIFPGAQAPWLTTGAPSGLERFFGRCLADYHSF
jgi:hypothetical protein